MKKKKLGKAQWRTERNKEVARRKLSASAERRAAKREEKKAMRRWENRFPKPGTKPSRPLPMQKRTDKEHLEVLRRENVSLVKTIAELKRQLAA